MHLPQSLFFPPLQIIEIREGKTSSSKRKFRLPYDKELPCVSNVLTPTRVDRKKQTWKPSSSETQGRKGRGSRYDPRAKLKLCLGRPEACSWEKENMKLVSSLESLPQFWVWEFFAFSSHLTGAACCDFTSCGGDETAV